ncbi:Potassium channel domain containing protein [Candidatus Nanopelagicaceae bacterium]
MNKPERFVQVVNSPKLLTLFSLFFLFAESGIYALFEKKDFLDSLWWALITATTVGYGDSYPSTTGGRFVAVTLVLGMILFLIPMITASIASKLIVNRDAFTHEEQEEMKNLLQEIRKHQIEKE